MFSYLWLKLKQQTSPIDPDLYYEKKAFITTLLNCSRKPGRPIICFFCILMTIESTITWPYNYNSVQGGH